MTPVVTFLSSLQIVNDEEDIRTLYSTFIPVACGRV